MCSEGYLVDLVGPFSDSDPGNLWTDDAAKAQQYVTWEKAVEINRLLHCRFPDLVVQNIVFVSTGNNSWKVDGNA